MRTTSHDAQRYRENGPPGYNTTHDDFLSRERELLRVARGRECVFRAGALPRLEGDFSKIVLTEMGEGHQRATTAAPGAVRPVGRPVRDEMTAALVNAPRPH